MAEVLVISTEQVATEANSIGSFGQSFTIPAGVQNVITKIRIRLYPAAGSVNNVTLTLYKGGGSYYTFPVSDVIGSSSAVVVFQPGNPYSAGYIDFLFPIPIPVKPLDLLTFILHTNTVGANGIGLPYAASNGGGVNYTGGEAYINGVTGVSQGHPDYVYNAPFYYFLYDLIFQVYMDTIANSITNTLIIN